MNKLPPKAKSPRDREAVEQFFREFEAAAMKDRDKPVTNEKLERLNGLMASFLKKVGRLQ